MIEHALLLALIALISSLVYHALRTDSVRDAIVLGTRRFLSFMLIAVVFGVCLQLFTAWL